MKYSGIINFDTNNGRFFRVSLFVSGCKRKMCKYCHNKEAQDFNFGKEYTQNTEDYIINLLKNKQIKGFNLIGGAPKAKLDDGEILKLFKRIRL